MLSSECRARAGAHREAPPERAWVVASPAPLILKNRLCAQTAFLAWAGRMRSASEEDLHNAHRSTLKAKGRWWSPPCSPGRPPTPDFGGKAALAFLWAALGPARVTLPSLPWCPQHGPELRLGSFLAVCVRPGSGAKLSRLRGTEKAVGCQPVPRKTGSRGSGRDAPGFGTED